MKIKIEKNILLENLNYVSKGLSSRNIIPVLNGIKFELTKEGLNLTATDNDITIKTFIDKKDIKEIEEVGTVIIYGKYLLEIIRKLSESIISIETIDGGKTIISTSVSKYNLNCFDEKDFPNIKIEKQNKPVVINTKELKTIINQTIFATSTQESRPLLTGINLKINEDYLECVATDSYRLAKKNILIDKVNDNFNIVIPARNISELIKIVEEDDENINVHIFKNKVLFEYKNILFQSSLLNGSYPNTDQLIPTEFSVIAEVELSDIYSAIDRAALLTQTKDKNIINLEILNDKLIITSSSLEIGKTEETVNLKNSIDTNFKISFSSKYMLEALKSFQKETVKLYFNGEVKPIIIKEDDSANLTQLILPIKTY